MGKRELARVGDRMNMGKQVCPCHPRRTPKISCDVALGRWHDVSFWQVRLAETDDEPRPLKPPSVTNDL